MGGEGAKKEDVKYPNLKYLFTRELFLGGGCQTIISFLNALAPLGLGVSVKADISLKMSNNM